MLRNTAFSYGSVAKFLHWLMAAWIVTAYVVIIWLTWDHKAAFSALWNQLK